MKLPIWLFPVPVLAFALVGCGSSAGDDPGNLSLACEMVKCECRPPKSSWSLSEAPGQSVEWRADGSAYCREGLALTRLNK
jgi:hypothetical protein